MIALELLAVKLPDPAITEVQRQMALAEIGQQIKNYCHIDEIPAALYFTQANMAADLLRYEQEAARPADEVEGRVSAISEGDTSVSFAKSDDRDRLLGEHRKMLDSLILGYRQQLQVYRKLRW